LLSFAQDLRTTVERESTEQTSLASLTAANGVLHITTRQREVLHITITAPAREPRRILVEIPKADGRTLTLEGDAVPGIEETATAWRLPVALNPGEVRKLTAYIDRLEREETALLDDDAQVAVRLLNEQALTPSARTALQRLAALRQDEAAKRAILNQLKAQQAAILQDEDRIRRNLAAVAANDALHGRLTRALEADEAKLDQISQAIDQTTTAADKAHMALADAVASLRL
jgi:ATP-dependent Clp protease ATP-binding subunit ClpA